MTMETVDRNARAHTHMDETSTRHKEIDRVPKRGETGQNVDHANCGTDMSHEPDADNQRNESVCLVFRDILDKPTAMRLPRAPLVAHSTYFAAMLDGPFCEAAELHGTAPSVTVLLSPLVSMLQDRCVAADVKERERLLYVFLVLLIDPQRVWDPALDRDAPREFDGSCGGYRDTFLSRWARILYGPTLEHARGGGVADNAREARCRDTESVAVDLSHLWTTLCFVGYSPALMRACGAIVHAAMWPCAKHARGNGKGDTFRPCACTSLVPKTRTQTMAGKGLMTITSDRFTLPSFHIVLALYRGWHAEALQGGMIDRATKAWLPAPWERFAIDWACDQVRMCVDHYESWGRSLVRCANALPLEAFVTMMRDWAEPLWPLETHGSTDTYRLHVRSLTLSAYARYSCAAAAPSRLGETASVPSFHRGTDNRDNESDSSDGNGDGDGDGSATDSDDAMSDDSAAVMDSDRDSGDDGDVLHASSGMISNDGDSDNDGGGNNSAGDIVSLPPVAPLGWHTDTIGIAGYSPRRFEAAIRERFPVLGGVFFPHPSAPHYRRPAEHERDYVGLHMPSGLVLAGGCAVHALCRSVSWLRRRTKGQADRDEPGSRFEGDCRTGKERCRTDKRARDKRREDDADLAVPDDMDMWITGPSERARRHLLAKTLAIIYRIVPDARAIIEGSVITIRAPSAPTESIQLVYTDKTCPTHVPLAFNMAHLVVNCTSNYGLRVSWASLCALVRGITWAMPGRGIGADRLAKARARGFMLEEPLHRCSYQADPTVATVGAPGVHPDASILPYEIHANDSEQYGPMCDVRQASNDNNDDGDDDDDDDDAKQDEAYYTDPESILREFTYGPIVSGGYRCAETLAFADQPREAMTLLEQAAGDGGPADKDEDAGDVHGSVISTPLPLKLDEDETVRTVLLQRWDLVMERKTDVLLSFRPRVPVTVVLPASIMTVASNDRMSPGHETIGRPHNRMFRMRLARGPREVQAAFASAVSALRHAEADLVRRSMQARAWLVAHMGGARSPYYERDPYDPDGNLDELLDNVSGAGAASPPWGSFFSLSVRTVPDGLDDFTSSSSSGCSSYGFSYARKTRTSLTAMDEEFMSVEGGGASSPIQHSDQECEVHTCRLLLNGCGDPWAPVQTAPRPGAKKPVDGARENIYISWDEHTEASVCVIANETAHFGDGITGHSISFDDAVARGGASVRATISVGSLIALMPDGTFTTYASLVAATVYTAAMAKANIPDTRMLSLC